jgi:ketosteroid isomerase-like protein
MSDPGGWTADNVADWIAIRELTARYNRAFDDVDGRAFAETFTEDGVFVLPNARPRQGHDDLAALVERVGYGSVHATTDAIIAIDGDRATQECTLVLARREADGSSVTFAQTGRYSDELVRTPAGWRFSRRTATLDLV